MIGFPMLKDMVLFWNKNLNHVSESRMIAVVQNKLIANLSSQFTVATIRKYMAVSLSLPSGSPIYPGEFFSYDTKNCGSNVFLSFPKKIRAFYTGKGHTLIGVSVITLKMYLFIKKNLLSILTLYK